MRITYTKRFSKQFNKLHTNIRKKFQERMKLFIKNPKDPILRNHELRGNLIGIKAFSVGGDIRVIYKTISNYLILAHIARFIKHI